MGLQHCLSSRFFRRAHDTPSDVSTSGYRITTRLSIILSIGYQSGDCGYCKAEDSSQRTPSSRAFPCCPSCLHPCCGSYTTSSNNCPSSTCSSFPTTMNLMPRAEHVRLITHHRCKLLCTIQSSQPRALSNPHGPRLEKIRKPTLSSRCL